MQVLLDADAFICLRKWSLLELLKASNAVHFLMTEYVARHELSDLRSDVDELLANGHLQVHAVVIRTAAHRRYRKLVRSGADKGEAESVAWAIEEADEPPSMFVSLDRDARRLARSEGLVAGDVLDLAILAVEQGHTNRDAVRDKLMVWDDSRQGFCRPRDFTTFDETWAQRVGR